VSPAEASHLKQRLARLRADTSKVLGESAAALRRSAELLDARCLLVADLHTATAEARGRAEQSRRARAARDREPRP
jgi:hypothetical protein